MINVLTPSATISRLSPAKINLFLHITGKRTDGYHDLQTVFRLLDWGDYLHFSVADNRVAIDDAPDVNMLCSHLIALTGAETVTTSISDNLIFKAARALLVAALELSKLPKSLSQVHITLDKHLPMGAGLGGGSSNAATTLLVLNEIWHFNFTRDTLMAIGAKIGADVPIFIFGQDAIGTGIGEQLTAIDLPVQQYLVLTPNAHINTAKLFAHPMLQRDIAALSIETIQNQASYYIQNSLTPYQNVFTPVVTSLAPAVNEARQYLQGLETQAMSTARMTGSGSAVFLPLDASIVTDNALLAKWVAEAPCAGYVVGSVKQKFR